MCKTILGSNGCGAAKEGLMERVRIELSLEGIFGTKLNSVCGEDVEGISRLGNWISNERSQPRQAV